MDGQSDRAGGYRDSKVWLVTGCSSGFGRMLVPAITSRGDRVIATARKLSDIQHLQHHERVKVLQLDVTAPEDVLEQRVDEAISMFGTIDILVNNAGYVLSGVWEELSTEDVKLQFETNFFGALKLTRSILPHMRLKRSGAIFFMGSISGWHGVAAGGAYSASKFALEGAVESLSKEVQQFNIRVQIFVIGQFRTSILDPKNKKSKLSEGIVDYGAVKKEVAAIHAATQGAQPGDPALAAERIVDMGRLEKVPLAGQLPLRIPIGSDSLEIMRRKCESTLALLDAWSDFASSTDFADKICLPGYYR